METVINLNIDESKFASQETSELVGCLKAVVVSADKPVNIIVAFADNLNVRVLELNNFIGEKYLCVRVPCNDYKGDIFSYQVEELYLNDRLLIQAQGMPGANVKVKFRSED